MYKKKEIIIIISIIFLTLLLAFLPTIINNHKKSNGVKEKESSNIIIDDSLIKIRVEGEVFYTNGLNHYNYYEFEIPKGYTYGFIIQKIEVYLTQYKKIDVNNYKTQYFKAETIIIESYDTGFEMEKEIIDDDKININTATKYALMSLYGIGDKRSDTIIEEREKKKIEDFDELQQLIGVSDEVIERIKEKAVCE